MDDENDLGAQSATAVDAAGQAVHAPQLPHDALTEWQRARFGDSAGVRLALAYYRERGWPVDDQNTTSVDVRIYAFQAGFEIGYESGRESTPVIGTGHPYVGNGPGCHARHPELDHYGCTRDLGHDGEHVAVGADRTDDEYGYLHWPQIGSGTPDTSAKRAASTRRSEAQ